MKLFRKYILCMILIYVFNYQVYAMLAYSNSTTTVNKSYVSFIQLIQTDRTCMCAPVRPGGRSAGSVFIPDSTL